VPFVGNQCDDVTTDDDCDKQFGGWSKQFHRRVVKGILLALANQVVSIVTSCHVVIGDRGLHAKKEGYPAGPSTPAFPLALNVRCGDGLSAADAAPLLQYLSGLPPNLPAGCFAIGS
jgi:hypothetical protein